MKNKVSKKDIAVIGLSCKFNKASNYIEYWDNLVNGVEMLDRYEANDLIKKGIDEDIVNNPSFIKVSSFVNNPESFDYPFFGYTKEEANAMDPQIRILHEQVWLALEDAGCDISKSKDKIGLYLAASENLNWLAHSMLNQNEKIAPFYQSKISNKNYISSLISYNLNLTGPSYYIDTACSSSLSAVHMACRSLLLRECSIAVSGGIKINPIKNYGYFYQDGMTASKDGKCRSFDSDSSGTVGGNGAGVVVLKRLEEAIEDGDPIHAVIKSSAVNNDGRRKVGYTAPSVTGQADCIKSAHKFAGVDSKTITYVETHGTATKLGDPIEIDALNEAFDYNSEHKCAIGSVKTNLGHLDTAAGVAGLIKTCLALSKRCIPPSLHFNEPNPNIDFDSGPFYVNSKTQPWRTEDNSPLRAGLSSIGIGGTNVHMVLEEFLENKKVPSVDSQLILLSAKTTKSLKSYCSKLTGFLKKQEGINIADLSYTLGTGRTFHKYRNYIVCKDKEGLLASLNNLTQEEHYKLNSKREIVFMFPGQGSQYFRMAKELYNEINFFKENIDLGLEILKTKTGEDFRAVLGYEEEEQDSELINETRYTQPLLFLIEYSLAKLLIEWGVYPNYMIGHSLGEYVAACLSGVFSLGDAIEIILKRASLMDKMEKGAMLYVGIPLSDIEPLLDDNISIAAINTEDSVVVSGTKQSIDKFQSSLEKQDIPSKVLKTSHAFHSYMMDDMLDDFKNELEMISLSDPKIPFISNLTGKPIKSEEVKSTKYWVDHLRHTVNFAKGIEYLTKNDSIFIEIGAGSTLTTFCKQNKHYSSIKHVSVNLMTKAQQDIDDLQFFMNGLGKLWVYGVEMNWSKVYQDKNRKKISIPGYSFDHYKLDFDINPFKKIVNQNFVSRKPISEWFYIPNWKKSVLQNSDLEDKNDTYLIFSDESPLIDSLIKKIRSMGNTVLVALLADDFEKIDKQLFGINPAINQNVVELFKSIDTYNIDKIVFGWDYEANSQSEIINVYKKYLNISKELLKFKPVEDKKVYFLSSLNNRVLGDESINITMSISQMLGKIIAQENPNISARFIDANAANIESNMIDNIVKELYIDDVHESIAYRKKERWIEFYDPIKIKDHKKPDLNKKLILITGGLGKIGQYFTNYLCDTHNAEVVLIGRSKLPKEDEWQNYLGSNVIEDSVKSNILKLKTLKDKGYKVAYYESDVSDLLDFENTINEIEKKHGSISGIIHAAGNHDIKSFRPVEEIDENAIIDQFNPKVAGTLNIHKIFSDQNLDFVWITSSLSSILGGLTYGAYASANRFIDGFIQHHKESLRNWISINLDGVGDNMITSHELITIFEKSLSLLDYKQLIISIKDINNVIQKMSNSLDQEIKEDSNNEIERPLLRTDFVLPTTDLEIQLCEMYQSFFGISEIGIKDDFFELGGDSLKAMTFIKRINAEFDVEINLKEFFSMSDVKKLGLKIDLLQKMSRIQNKEKGKNIIKI
ncbi:SDR family NAD(P)-dependent oxidoreductase [Aquimarina sp. MMG015]|uniref:type I polyketide synthase n=1 Tax=Aquimarina sp. MMG015 TaxID=2822689 RepID=UPI001B3A5A20|nr:type I polyketide synthase [Aquimarina sp. MMG015]MBQ4803345.1 SDR family NAD(P)-dependent oxidoreductase [Aquimarina sp. MMG015]